MKITIRQILLTFSVFILFTLTTYAGDFGKIKKESWEKAKKGIEYKPMKEKEEEEKSEETPARNDSFRLPSLGSDLATIIFYTLVTAVLAVIIGVLIKNVSSSNADVERKELYRQLDTEEDIAETDLAAYLKKALELEDYTLALRIKYLMIIKELTTSNIIVWSKEKTNGEYLREVRQHPIFNDFRNATFAFERVWYGEEPFSKADYEPLSAHFDALTKTVQPTPNE